MTIYRKSVSLAAFALAGVASATQAASYDVTITNLTNAQYFTPLLAAAHDPGIRLFHAGEPASAELQAIAEGGDIAPMMQLLDGVGAVQVAGEGLLAPGASVTLTLENVSAAHRVLSLGGMLLPTNDGFVGIDSVALPMDADTVVLHARAYDAGTEGNDEVIGSGAPGAPGFPAPPPVVASGTGTGASGIVASAEGFVHVHRGVIGDLDSTGGQSDINAAVHRFQNPVARVTIERTSGDGTSDLVVNNLSGVVYSSSALELFWDPSLVDGVPVAGYRIARDGEAVAILDALSFFDQSLAPDTVYHYSVTPIDNQGASGLASDIQLTTNAR